MPAAAGIGPGRKMNNKGDINLRPLIESLVGSLREQMTGYGELLALQQEQQEFIINRQVPELLENARECSGQDRKITQLSQARDRVRETLVTQLGLPQEVTFREMTGQLPEEYRPLLEALRDEINALIQKKDMWARHNKLFITRAQGLLEGVMQDATTGQKGAQASPGALYEGVI